MRATENVPDNAPVDAFKDALLSRLKGRGVLNSTKVRVLQRAHGLGTPAGNSPSCPALRCSAARTCHCAP